MASLINLLIYSIFFDFFEKSQSHVPRPSSCAHFSLLSSLWIHHTFWPSKLILIEIDTMNSILHWRSKTMFNWLNGIINKSIDLFNFFRILKKRETKSVPQPKPRRLLALPQIISTPEPEILLERWVDFLLSVISSIPHPAVVVKQQQ